MSGAMGWFFILLLFAIAGVFAIRFGWLYRVNAPDVGVVDTFGSLGDEVVRPGLHLRYPWQRIRIAPGNPMFLSLTFEDTITTGIGGGSSGASARVRASILYRLKGAMDPSHNFVIDAAAAKKFVQSFRSQQALEKAFSSLVEHAVEQIVPTYRADQLNNKRYRTRLLELIVKHVEERSQDWGITIFPTLEELSSPAMTIAFTSRDEAVIAEQTKKADAVGIGEAYRYLLNTAGQSAADAFLASYILKFAKGASFNVLGNSGLTGLFRNLMGSSGGNP